MLVNKHSITNVAKKYEQWGLNFSGTSGWGVARWHQTIFALECDSSHKTCSSLLFQYGGFSHCQTVKKSSNSISSMFNMKQFLQGLRPGFLNETGGSRKENWFPHNLWGNQFLDRKNLDNSSVVVYESQVSLFCFCNLSNWPVELFFELLTSFLKLMNVFYVLDNLFRRLFLGFLKTMWSWVPDPSLVYCCTLSIWVNPSITSRFYDKKINFRLSNIWLCVAVCLQKWHFKS